jgi:hypothetical protein
MRTNSKIPPASLTDESDNRSIAGRIQLDFVANRLQQ